MRISDCSSDVCSSDLACEHGIAYARRQVGCGNRADLGGGTVGEHRFFGLCGFGRRGRFGLAARREGRSEEHTSELQSLMRISYAVFCLKKKNNTATSSEADTYQLPTISQHSTDDTW